MMDADRRKTFDKMFSPGSLAIIGISRTSGGLGGQFFLKNLQRAGFPGRIYLIHPAAREISGMPTYPNISALPEAVDLIIVCVPASVVLSVLEECSRKGVRNVHILSSGFKELGTPEGKRLEEEVQFAGMPVAIVRNGIGQLNEAHWHEIHKHHPSQADVEAPE